MRILRTFLLLLRTLILAIRSINPYRIIEIKIKNKAELEKNYEYNVIFYKEQITFEVEIEGFNKSLKLKKFEI